MNKDDLKRAISIADIMYLFVKDIDRHKITYIDIIQEIKSITLDEIYNNDMKVGAIMRVLLRFGVYEDSNEQINRLSRELTEIRIRSSKKRE